MKRPPSDHSSHVVVVQIDEAQPTRAVVVSCGRYHNRCPAMARPLGDHDAGGPARSIACAEASHQRGVRVDDALAAYLDLFG